MANTRLRQYINDSLFFVVRPDESRGAGTYVYCSGVNLDAFLPLTRGRHGLASNPALRGLQLVNLDVREIALSLGATPKALRGNACDGITPSSDGWYKELLLIEKAPETLPDAIISSAALNLLKRVFKACMLDVRLPDAIPSPAELQSFIEGVLSTYGR